MNLHRKLMERAEAREPIRVGLIGVGKFATMFLAQALRTPGLHVMAVADLDPARARENLIRAGWSADRLDAASPEDARKSGATHIGDDAETMIAAAGIDVIIEATGDPAAGIRHALSCIHHGRHVVMVTVEADALAGPALAQRARAAGIVYSLAYGDQPALIAEQVDWARAAGFTVVCAGKGTKYLPAYHASTPETVWAHYGLDPETARAGGMNPQMFNSFLDGSKSAIEMAAVANATGLRPGPDGLAFPAAGVDDLAQICRPETAGGILPHGGTVEVVSSLHRDGRPVERDLRWGVYVVVEAASDYVARCFSEYGLVTDDSGRYMAMYRPWHLIGLELGISVASVALRGEATGTPAGFHGDVVAVAKRDLAVGETLDGEGGYTVWGRLMPAADSLTAGGFPLGLAHGVRLAAPVAAGAMLRWTDVVVDEAGAAVALRRESEALYAPAP